MSILFDKITFRYEKEGKAQLTEFSHAFSRDRITILTGASGCGKSTLLYLAAGIYPANGGFVESGRVTVVGEEIANPQLRIPKRAQLVGMMFQNPELQFCMDTVEHELVFCLENICVESEKMEQRVDEALDFCEIRHLKTRKLQTLSGGERQKVMLACMVLLRPQWMLLDEPFANIDNQSAREIAGKLGELHRTYGVGILAVDHRLDYWLGIADEVCVMRDGAILPDAMSVDALDEKLLTEYGIIVPGGSYPGLAAYPPAVQNAELLTINGVSVSYDKHKEPILRDVNATFREGEMVAIVGESGCGKSTLFAAMEGILPYRGSICLGGLDIKKNRRKLVGRIGFVTQNPQDQFVGDHVRHEILLSLKGREDAEEVSEQILRSIKLWRYRDCSQYQLSQGQQRRLGVAALMAYDCKVLVCDEPTYAQDRNNTIAIMDALAKQAREQNTLVIFTTHDPAIARDYADRILQLKEGMLHEVH